MLRNITTKALLLVGITCLLVVFHGCDLGTYKKEDQLHSFESTTLSTEHYDEEGVEETFRRVTYSYNNAGDITEIKEFNGISSDPISVDSYEYNEENELVAHYRCGFLLEEYEYDNGKCISEKRYDNEGNVIELHTFSYENGILASAYSEIHICPDIETVAGEIVTTEQIEYYYKEYSSSGQLAKETCYEYKSEPYCKEYSYLENKTIIKSITLSGEHFFTETKTYDDKNRDVSIHWLFADDGSTSETKYTYEENMIIETYFSEGNEQHYSVSKYNAEGYIVSHTTYSAENEQIRLVEFEYDEHNNINKMVRTDDKKTITQYAPERVFDAEGKILSETYCPNVDYFSAELLELYQIRYIATA